jgi:hypothetical protein
MLTYEMLVWLSFRFVDLLIILALFVYGFIKWGLPLLRKNVLDEQQKKQNLANDVEHLHNKAQLLDTKLVQDDAHISLLEHQVRLWQETYKRKHNKRALEKEDIKIRLEKSYVQRIEEIAQQKLYDKVVPDAIAQAEDALKKKFDNNADEAFVDALLMSMQKEDI